MFYLEGDLRIEIREDKPTFCVYQKGRLVHADGKLRPGLHERVKVAWQAAGPWGVAELMGVVGKEQRAEHDARMLRMAVQLSMQQRGR